MAELSALESPSAPELPEPHHGQDEGETKEKIFDRSSSNSGADNRIRVIHDDRFSICAKVREPPIS
jgi:hypothetical protein